MFVGFPFRGRNRDNRIEREILFIDDAIPFLSYCLIFPRAAKPPIKAARRKPAAGRCVTLIILCYTPPLLCPASCGATPGE